MLAMQYSFTLPADYEMSIIRERIATNGQRMDGFPHLAFKAFLQSSRDPEGRSARENLYAPFYLWENNEGINRFLSSPGFAALTNAFGWPAIKIWSVWKSCLSPALTLATCATREIVQIDPFSDLAELQEIESQRADSDVNDHAALASLVGFEPGTWTLVRFRLWQTRKDDMAQAGIQRYEIGYLATPGNFRS